MVRSKQFVIAICVAVGMLAAEAPLRADSILSASVSFNPTTDLYTYSYAINNASGPAAIDELAVLVDTASLNFHLFPNAYSSPPGWSLATAVSGSTALPPVDEYGTFWEWVGRPVPVGSSLSGFSFTTAAAPTTSTANDYFLFSPTFSGGPLCCQGIVAYGNVVAPNLDDVASPEPASILLFLIGLSPLVWSLLRRSGRTSYGLNE